MGEFGPPGVGIRRGSEVVSLSHLDKGSTGVVVGGEPEPVTGNVWVCWGSQSTLGSPIQWHPSEMALDPTTVTGQQHAALWLFGDHPWGAIKPTDMDFCARRDAFFGKADPAELTALMWRVYEEVQRR